jgi:hypothetical protein
MLDIQYQHGGAGGFQPGHQWQVEHQANHTMNKYNRLLLLLLLLLLLTDNAGANSGHVRGVVAQRTGRGTASTSNAKSKDSQSAYKTRHVAAKTAQ